jgi:hypothetical protein
MMNLYNKNQNESLMTSIYIILYQNNAKFIKTKKQKNLNNE